MSDTSPALSVTKPPVRPPVRPEPRSDDPRERARLRAAEVRKHRGNIPDGDDQFYIDPDKIPSGWDYGWKVHTVLGKEFPERQIAMASAGWEAVPASRHPEMMPAGSTHSTILREGLILMERPLELTIEARTRDLKTARRQVKAKEEQLGETPRGTLDRDADPRVRPRVGKHYEPIAIPPDPE